LSRCGLGGELLDRGAEVAGEGDRHALVVLGNRVEAEVFSMSRIDSAEVDASRALLPWPIISSLALKASISSATPSMRFRPSWPSASEWPDTASMLLVVDDGVALGLGLVLEPAALDGLGHRLEEGTVGLLGVGGDVQQVDGVLLGMPKYSCGLFRHSSRYATRSELIRQMWSLPEPLPHCSVMRFVIRTGSVQ
jgi:hypothetical protein